MSIELSRADVLRGRFIAIAEAARPPYAIPEQDFRGRCEPCGACRDACETRIIGQDAEGYPILLFGQAGCSFCGACAAACPAGALSLEQARAWTIAAHVKASCLSFNAITCRACEESCKAGAIRFRLMTGGRALPLVDEENCVGCGDCALICPSQSIEMRSRNTEEVMA
ncbi:ferredoxin-type protein [bacterium BMS3Bbin10]|nr:ferredoxin-type protein [bacterium BMS3Bbin10]